MGMYTEIFVNVDLKDDTPEDVLNTLRAMCGEAGYKYLLNDKPGRWAYLFYDGSYYTPLTSCRMLTHDNIGGYWSLLAKGDIKNYEEEIEAFFAWIEPYVQDKGCEKILMGYHRYEESAEPVLIYKKTEE